MKILAIRGKNLASLEGEFEVDFTVEPLRSAGVFAITGSTGAGKTTILDAMCIALYERSPRLESIKNSTTIEEYGKTAIKENDARTILRKGKHEGYAEVDFLAVNGHRYRIRWSVSRANNKSNGNFRPSSYDLTDLDSGEHRSMKTTEFKATMPQLIGLEYEQFTRAVLLAQGNFAAFLKAEENEKAEILETLTGAEIYSRISALIYRKAQDAAMDLKLIDEKRRTLQLLEDSELEELKNECGSLKTEQDECNAKSDVLKIKKGWFERAAQLALQLTEAEEQQRVTKERLLEMQPVIQRLQLIDSVQQIRDDYTALRSLKEQYRKDNVQLTELNGLLNLKSADLEKSTKAVEEAVAKQEQANSEVLAAQPLIIEAARLEKLLANDSNLLSEIKDGIAPVMAEHNRLVAEMEKSNNRITAATAEQENINNWFGKHEGFTTVIPMIPSIIANIKAANNDRMQIVQKSKSLASATKLLDNYEKQLVVAQQNDEKLKQTMSSEIATLRKRLVEGEACPVCGSRHHEVVHIAEHQLLEKELEEARENSRLLLDNLESGIKDRRREIDRLNSAIELHNEAIANYHKANIGYMADIDDAEALLACNGIEEELTTLSSNWNSYKERLVAIGEELSVCRNNMTICSSALKAVDTDLEKKNALAETLVKNIDGYKERVNSITGKWKTAEAMQEHCNDLIQKANKAFVDATEAKSATDIECNRLKGQILEKKEQLEKASARISALQENVDRYLDMRSDGMTLSRLDELFSVDSDTIAEMRGSIKLLDEAITSANVTIAERKQNIEEHNKAEIRPGEEENAESVTTALAEISKKLQEILESISKINAKLIKDAENRAKFSQYSDEYDTKMQTMKHWNTLNTLFGSAKGDKLRRLAQGYTLDILLDVANMHLANITKRYKLARISSGSLAIKVIDLDMMSETRSAHSLSGGETFIVSLALSLALSSISSNRMNIGSLFIDEGFGSLDSDTLRTAIMALEKLQSQGRNIGVISHLAEMLEKIPVKVKVYKIASGKSKIEIVNNG